VTLNTLCTVDDVLRNTRMLKKPNVWHLLGQQRDDIETTLKFLGIARRAGNVALSQPHLLCLR
jgi:hypothetical protein